MYVKEMLCFMILFNMFKTDGSILQYWAQLFKTIDIVRQQDVNPLSVSHDCSRQIRLLGRGFT